MGPNIILDKSVFQRLGAREHTFLHKHYYENLTPVLAVEILSDLKKVATAKRPMAGNPEAEVKLLAKKFGGSGPMVNVDYTTLLAGTLLGSPVPMTGQIVVGHGVRSADGRGVMIDLHPINHAILRWREGRFKEWEQEAAGWLRQASQDVRFEDFQRHLTEQRVLVPKAESLGDLGPIAKQLLNEPSLQEVWLGWATELGRMEDHEVGGAWFRWRVEKATSLERFAPFAGHCIRTLLTLITAVRSKLIKWDASHARDMEYLLYLPFCEVFSSADKMHVALAPQLLRSDQVFVDSGNLKADLKAIAEFWKALSEGEQRRAHWTLGMYPPPLKPSVTWDIWRQFRGVLRPGSNKANHLPPSERPIGLAELRARYDSAGYVWDAFMPDDQ